MQSIIETAKNLLVEHVDFFSLCLKNFEKIVLDGKVAIKEFEIAKEKGYLKDLMVQVYYRMSTHIESFFSLEEREMIKLNIDIICAYPEHAKEKIISTEHLNEVVRLYLNIKYNEENTKYVTVYAQNLLFGILKAEGDIKEKIDLLCKHVEQQEKKGDYPWFMMSKKIKSVLEL